MSIEFLVKEMAELRSLHVRTIYILNFGIENPALPLLATNTYSSIDNSSHYRFTLPFYHLFEC
jgi:hypothetical protein